MKVTTSDITFLPEVQLSNGNDECNSKKNFEKYAGLFSLINRPLSTTFFLKIKKM
jgi:hypothetical protein